MNLIEAIQAECTRCRELILTYVALPEGVGVLGAVLIRVRIKEGEASIASGDIVRMTRAFASLKECK